MQPVSRHLYDLAAAEAAEERLKRKRARLALQHSGNAGSAEVERETGAPPEKVNLKHQPGARPDTAQDPPVRHKVKQRKLHDDQVQQPEQRRRSDSVAVAQPSKAACVRAQKALSAALTPRQKLMQSLNVRPDAVTPAAKASLTFDADWHDHCETPFEAFRDIEPILFRIATALGRTKESLVIYDPYFCEGTMRSHLARLGFTNVYNRDEDCYAVWAAGRTPAFDVLLTNPPFSGDHMLRALRFAATCGKPFLLLLPNFVCYKKSYDTVVPPAVSPAFLVPSRRYVFYAPGRTNGDVTAPTSPFDTFWHISMRALGGNSHEEICSWWERKYATATKATLARTRDAVPKLVTPVRDEKRGNPKARRRAAKRAAFLHAEKGISFAHIAARAAKKQK